MPSNQIQFVANTYAGELKKGFMAATLLGADSVKRGFWTVMEDVKFKDTILDLDDVVFFQNPSDAFSPQNSQPSQNETYVQPVPYEFMQQLNYSDLVKSWESRDMKSGAFGDYEAPTYLSDWMVNRYIPKIAQLNESLYYRGKQGTPNAIFTDNYPGLLPRVEADGSVFKLNLKTTEVVITAIDDTGRVTYSGSDNPFRDGDVVTLVTVTGNITDNTFGTPISLQGQSYVIRNTQPNSFQLYANYNRLNRTLASFTGTSTGGTAQFINVSNVLTVLSSIYAQIDEADRQQDDIKILAPYHIMYAYRTAQSEKAINVLNAYPQKKSTDFEGMSLEAMNFWNGNSIMVARTSNLFLGVDLLSDDTDLRVKYLGDVTLDNFVRMKARMKSDTNFKFGNEILWLRPSEN